MGYKIRTLSLLPRYLQKRILFSRYNQEISASGEYELRLLSKLLKPDDVALDVGANLGVYSYLLSTICARTIGFEPNATLAKILERLRLPRLEIVNAAVSSSVGVAELVVPKSRSGHVLASLHPRLRRENGDQVDVFNVKTVTIDSLQLSKVDFIKIDVEGFEDDVIKGAELVLDTHKPIILCEIEERHNPGGLDRINKYLSEKGYEGYFFKSNQMHDIQDFCIDKYQNYAESHTKTEQNRSNIDYINNFMFIHRERDLLEIKRDLGLVMTAA